MDSLLSKFPMNLVWLKITDKETVMKRNHKKVWSIGIIDLFQREISTQVIVLKLKTQNMKEMKRIGTLFNLKHQCTGADQGFPRGAQTYYLAKISWNCMKMKNIGPRGRVNQPLCPWLTYMTCTDFVGGYYNPTTSSGINSFKKELG